MGGARFEQGTFRDTPIKAIVPLSPQGPGNFGAFDTEPNLSRPSTENSWAPVTLPAFNPVGSLEKDGPVGHSDLAENRRLLPFERYPLEADKHLSVMPGQDHGDMGNGGSTEVQRFIARHTRLFFDVCLRARTDSVRSIGQVDALPGTLTRRRVHPQTGLARGCGTPGGGSPRGPSSAGPMPTPAAWRRLPRRWTPSGPAGWTWPSPPRGESP